MIFLDKLNTRIRSTNSLLCVGLDPNIENIPKEFCRLSSPYYEFGKDIVDQTAKWACAFKLQIAYYASCGREEELEQTIAYISKQHPNIPVILDAKRGDIGDTAKMYAKEAFERYKADAVTINPYMGLDTLTPFLEYREHGVFVLCRTSNPSSDDMQTLKIKNDESANSNLFHHVADLCANQWNKNQNIALVVGATFPESLAQVRKIVGNMPILVPGVGFQGGDLEAVLHNGLDGNGSGLIINVGRSILYPEKGTPCDIARQYYKKINTFRNH